MSKDIHFVNNQGPIAITTEAQISRASILGKLVEIIASTEVEQLDMKRVPAEIEHKIEFNDLLSHRHLITNFIDNALMIDKSMEELNQTILNGSTKLKRQMKLFYMEALHDFSISTDPIDLDKLKTHSDDIVRSVIALTTKQVVKSSNVLDGYFEEDIHLGVSLITSYSIIECVVLENPNDYN